ncbi:MAG TPA: hypothetical protein VJS17_04025 [Pyrinomonadaceae bacterium]|nr:hypothetical protein [Pyrinomonadaceae bacterium]
MSQQQQSLLESNMDGFRNGGSLGFATGSTCSSSGTFRAYNKYMDNILVLAAGDVFPAFSDGKKCTWYALGPSSKSGFESVRVEAGAA